MLYLEDYLEMIENLPIEMREKFTEIREMDLQVQNALDNLDERVKAFFKKCGSTPPPKQEWRDEQMEKIKQDFAKVVEDADEKVQLSGQMHELVERTIRKLDSELAKFKMELEADNAGITEVLEKRSLDMESHPHDNKHGRGEKRRGHMPSSGMYGSYIPKRPALESAIIDVGRDVSGYQRGPSSTSSSPASGMFSSGSVPPGPNSAIAVAASKAIGATHEMSQGRRTASLKASYEAINRGADLSKELQLRVLNPSMPVSAPLEPPITIRIQATKKARQQGGQMSQMVSHEMLSSSSSSGDLVRQQHQQEEGTSWQYDPNEPRYCLCNDVSYGEMVGCDNNDCPIEWFHYGCVGLTHAPKGKWYCPQCLAAMKRRGRK